MKNFIPLTDVQKTLETLTEKVRADLLNSIEKPLTTEDFAVFGYPSKKAMQNDLHRLPVRTAPNGKRFIYLSEFNAWVKR